MSIKAKIFTSSLWSIAGTSTTLLCNFIVFALLARLLEPVDFGLVAFAAIFIDVSRHLMSGGIAEALISRKDWNEVTASTAFWLNLASTLVFTTIIAAIVAPLAYIYGSPSLGEVFLALSLSLVLDGARAVHEAKLRRDFGYKVLATRTVVASIVSGIAGIALAFAGFGVWALVANRLIAATLQTAIVLRVARWAPSAIFSRAECFRLLTFGVDMIGVRLIGQFNRRVSEFVVGLVLGPAALGLFNVASRALVLLFQIAISPIQTTALSAFSRLHDTRAVRDAYLRLTRTTSLVAYPVYFGAAAIAPDFVVLCFGPQWQASGTIMAILALIAIPSTLVAFSQPALIAIGRSRLAFLSSLGVFVTSAITSLIAVNFGILAVAVTRTIRTHAVAPFVLFILKKGIGLSISRALRSIWEPGLAAALMGGAVALVRLYVLDDLSPVMRLPICITLGAAIYAALLLIIGRRYTAETMLELMPHLPGPVRGIAQKIVPRI